MMLLGIDPGLDGALALLTPHPSAPLVQTINMPTLTITKAKRDLDPHTLYRELLHRRLGHAFLERQYGIPGQNSASVFGQGKNYGIVIGILAALGIPFTIIAPNVWKKELQVPAAKDGARARANQLLPYAADQWLRKKDDGRAEAAMIALYGYRSLNSLAVNPNVTVAA